MKRIRLEGEYVVKAPRERVYEIIADVEIKSPLFRILGGLLLKRIAIRYWERAVIGEIRHILE